MAVILLSPSMSMFANAVDPPPNWDVTGEYVIDLLVDDDPSHTHYTEYLDLTQDLTGTITGVSLALAGPTSVWYIDTGSVSGNSINFYGHFESNLGRTIHFWGDIASDGSFINGGWEDLAGDDRTGTWETTDGWASPIVFQILNLPEGVTATIEIIEVEDLPDCIPALPDGLLTMPPYINVEIEGDLEGSVTVAYYYDDADLTIEQERKLRLYMSGHCVDFNCDGTINGQDLTIIMKGINNGVEGIETSCETWLTFDLNNDEEYDDLDLNIVKDFMTKGLIVNQLDIENERSQARLPWMDITTDVDTELKIIYGETDYFSIFRGR